MDQKTIDKVLRCRAIIDRHRDWLREKFDKLEADVAAETAKLESKDKGDERKIAAIAEAVKIPDHDRFVDVCRMLAELKAEGFEGVGEYADWDNQQCLDAYIEYAPIAGECDHCKGLKGTPPCQQKWGEKSCAVTMNYPTLEWVKRYVFLSAYRSTDKAIRDILPVSIGLPSAARDVVTICPPGHGFYVVERKDAFPFDLRWEALRECRR